MLRARYPQGQSIDLRKAAKVGLCALDRLAAQLCALQATRQDLTRDVEIVDRTLREQSVPDIQSLRDGVEGKGDERPGGGVGLARQRGSGRQR